MLKIFLSSLIFLLSPSLFADALDRELQTCASAWREVKNQNYKKAQQLASPKTCPLTYSFTTWKKLRHQEASFSEYSQFISTHPNWPWMTVLLKKAEKSLNKKTPDTQILQWFGKHKPVTPSGALAYLHSLNRTKNKDKAPTVARQAWHNLDFSATEQKTFLKLFGHHLRPEDHRMRISSLLTNLKIEEAKKMIPLLHPQDKPMMQARLAFCENQDHAHELLKSHMHSHDLYYDQLRWYRKRDDLRGADLLKNIPAEKTQAQQWWRERSFFARESLNQGNPELAYNTMAAHPYTDGPEYADAEFFCGWVALRFLQNPPLALKHFQRFAKKTTLPKSKAKASFWLGRTYDALDETEPAQKAYKEAAAHTSTYYGMIAKRKFEQNIKLKPAKDPQLDPKSWEDFQKKDMVRMARLLKKAGLNVESEPFLYLLARQTAKGTKEQKLMGLKIIHEVYSPYLIFGSKDIRYQEAEFFPWLYPRHKIENKSMQQGVDPHLIHAIIRQESGFNTAITSPAGAMGMMQLMPQTASYLAKKHGYAHENKKLHQDPQYNILLGTHYLKEMLDEFNGSYVLAIAAYNCGPNPVKKWIEKFGDPRTDQVDTLDFIERIPYAETREYVKSVLANYYVYQAMEP
ncbi:MAG: lytic transglycosylase domain-containing protein [Alphaproteobacteria bacterium]|nr:lytic transglycosylase domain-containing protein [Alphaproteobacteria bacterium]